MSEILATSGEQADAVAAELLYCAPYSEGLHRLPTEVLAMIFRCLGGINGANNKSLHDTRSELSAVCTSWRDIVQRDSFYWSEVILGGTDTVDTLNDRLARSGSWPLTLRVDPIMSANNGRVISWTSAVGALGPHTARLRVLELVLYKPDWMSQHTNSLPALDAPTLERLHIRIVPTMPSVITLEIHAPRVTDLMLRGVRPSDWSAVLSGRTESVNVQQGFSTDAAILHGIISRCQALRELHIVAPVLRDLDAAVYAGLRPLALHSLTVMCIDEHLLAAVLQLPVLAVPSIPRISIAYPAHSGSGMTAGGMAAGALLAGFGPAAWVRMHEHVVEIGNAAGFTRVLTIARGLQMPRAWPVVADLRAQGVFAGTAAVSVAAHRWGDLAAAAPFLRRDLHVTLLLEPGEFTTRAFKWEPVLCASLGRLTLRCSSKDQETTVEKEDIEHIFATLGHRTDDVEFDHVVMAPDKDEKIERFMEAWDALERDRGRTAGGKGKSAMGNL